MCTGKSTVAALLERFYDPDNGVIMLDGLDIQTLDLSWLRGQVIGFINQVRIVFFFNVQLHSWMMNCTPVLLLSLAHLLAIVLFFSIVKGARAVRLLCHGEHPLWQA